MRSIMPRYSDDDCRWTARTLQNSMHRRPLMRLHAIFILGIILIGGTVFAAEAKTEPKPQFERPFPIVVVASGASDAHKAAAKKLGDAISVHVISEMPRNPVCCIWIEVTGWTPNPG